MEMDEEASDAYQPSVEIEEREAHLQNTEQCDSIRKVDDSQLAVEPEFEFASADDDAKEAIVEEETPTPREMGDSQLVNEPESDISKDDNDVKEAAVEYKTPEPSEDYSQLAIEPEIAAPKDDNGGKEAVAEVDDLLHVVEPELSAPKEDSDDEKEEEAAAEEEETPASRDIDESQRAVETELAAPMEDAGEKDGEEETSESQDGKEETSESHEMDVSQLAVEPEPAVPMEDAGYEKGGEAAAEEEKFPSPFEMNWGDDLQLEPELTAAEDDDDEEAVAGEEESPTPREMDNSQLVVEPELAVTTIAAGDNDDEEAVVGEEETPTPREMDNSQLVVESELAVTKDDDEEAVAEGEENPTPEMETEMEVAEAGRGSGGRKKRGRNSRATVKVTPKKKREEEDVCFICFDGGDLFLCDRRGCSKAYHPSCVNRDEAFFRAKGRWNCGWHQCSICEKNAYYMCYTCTYSLCKNCIKNAVILCVRGSKGFCETCIQTIRLIEKNEQGNNETAQVDFDDKSSFEYLFKDYWVGLKGKLLLTSDEIAQAKNPWKGSDVHAGKQDTTDELYDANNDGGSASDSSGNLEATSSKRRKAKKRSKSKEGDSPIASDSSYGNLEAKKSKKRKTKKRLKPRAKESDSPSAASAISAEGTSTPGNTEWASKELLEFVMHMRDGDASVLSQFDVQELLLKYITMNNLRDPRRKSYTICDSRLENLFGKPRVQHMEMLKLLESHFFIKEDSQADDLQGSVVDTEGSQLEADEHDALMKGGKDDKRKRKRGGERGLQSNLDGYAAIDIHNINLVYLRRNLMEAIIDDTETFHDKVVGSFVRIRISGSGQKHDMYRLVQIVGTNKAAEPYKVGKKTTDIMLEILNLNKTEVISIDIISNQEFTEDECKRLRQSIKCGLINRLTVGEIQEKALALQAVRVNDWLEAEVLRLNHLRDRASDMGRKKEHRECVEKLQLLETPEERQRRLEEVPEVHEDPNMDPNYESEDEGETEDKKRENFMKQRGRGGFSRRGMDQVSPREGSGFNRRGMDPISSREGGGFFNRRGMDPVSPREGSGFFNRRGMDPVSPRDGGVFNRRGRDPVSPHNDAWSGSRNREFGRSMSNRGFSIKKEDTTSEILSENPWSQGRDRDPHQLNSWDNKQKTPIMERGGFDNNTLSIPKSVPFSETSPSTISAAVATPASNISETDKMWHYKDPSGTVQGPFSIVQLRKWNNTGYFPKDLRIWKTNEKPEDAIILTDLLAGNSLTNAPVKEEQGGKAGLSVETLKVSTNGWGSELGINNSSNLPSPTPSQTTAGRTGGEQASEEKVSKFYHVRTTEVVEFSQQIGVNVPSSAPVPATPTPDSRNSGANMVQSVNMQQISASESQVWGNAPSQPNHQMHHMPIQQQQQQQQQQQPPFGHWGNPPSTIQNPVGNFQNQGFSGMPPSEPWRPPVQNNPSNMQQLPGPPNMNTGWAPMQGNPNMGWGGPGPMPGNQNINWGAPVQGPTPGNPNSNPGWGVQPVQGPTPGNAIPAWGVVPGQGQPPGNVNPGWGVVPGQAPNPSWGPPNQGWVVSNQAQPVPGNTNPGWVQPGQAPMPGNPNPGWVQPGQGPVPGNPNPGWVQPGQAPAPVPIPGNVNNPGQAPPPGNGNWVAPNQGPAPVNMNTGWVPTSQGAAPGNANQGWVPPSGNQNNGGGGRFSGQRGGRGGRTITCYNCGQAGHYARECTSKNMNTQQRRQ